MAEYVYKSTTGKTINIDNYIVTPNPGLYSKVPIKVLDLKLGNSIQRYTNGVLDVNDSSGGSVASTSRNVGVADVDTIIRCTAAATLTIQNDATGGFDPSEINIIRSYQATTGAVSFAAGGGVTLRGSPKSAAQYVIQQVIRVGPNEWSYIS